MKVQHASIPLQAAEEAAPVEQSVLAVGCMVGSWVGETTGGAVGCLVVGCLVVGGGVGFPNEQLSKHMLLVINSPSAGTKVQHAFMPLQAAEEAVPVVQSKPPAVGCLVVGCPVGGGVGLGQGKHMLLVIN